MLGVIFFFHFYANVQRSMTYDIYCYITMNLTTRERGSRLQHMEVLYYNGRFQFIKVCMGSQRLCYKSHLFLCFVN